MKRSLITFAIVAAAVVSAQADDEGNTETRINNQGETVTITTNEDGSRTYSTEGSSGTTYGADNQNADRDYGLED